MTKLYSGEKEMASREISGIEAVFMGVRNEAPRRLVRLQSATVSELEGPGVVHCLELLAPPPMTSSVVESHTPT